MPILSVDDIDFGAYERETEARAKIRRASLFADQLDAQFAHRDRNSRRPRMSSTKLGGALEFRPGEVTVWAGYNGHRKSLVTGQVMLDLASQGERVLSMSFEMLPGATLARQCRQFWASGQPNARQRADFLTWTDDRLWMFDHIGRFSSRKCVATLAYFAQTLFGTHVFIDSLMMVCESEESLDEQKQLVTDLVRVAQETGMHLHLIAHCRKPGDDDARPPSKYSVKGSSTITDLPHNIVTVWANQAKKAEVEAKGANVEEKWLEQPDALLWVCKQRNGAYEGKLKLWFDEVSFRFFNERTSPIEPYAIEAWQHDLDEVTA